MNRMFASLIFSLLFAVLSGCGFHLRGDAEISDSLKTLYVQGIDLRQNALGLELKRALIRNGINVISDYEKGTAILTILENHQDRRVLSIGTDAKVSEYELESWVTFKVSDDKGQTLMDVQKVEASRDYQFDSNQVLAMDEQQRVLQGNLDKQLVQNILRRLSAIK